MKIIISPGFGGGWSTWCSAKNKEDERKILTWKPMIEALERGEKLNNEHPAFLSLKEAVAPETYLVECTFDQLVVEEVEDGLRFRVDEYDGYESVEYADCDSFMDTWEC